MSFAQILFCALILRRIGQGEWVFFRWLKEQLRMPVEAGGERRRPGRRARSGQPDRSARGGDTRPGVAGFFARTGFTILGLILGLILIFLTTSTCSNCPARPRPRWFQDVLFSVLLLEVSIITLVALYMSAAGSVSREREDGTLDLLLTTPTTPRQYIWGQACGLASFLSLLLAVPVLTVAMVSVYAVMGKFVFTGCRRSSARTSMNQYGGTVTRFRYSCCPRRRSCWR
ncbi:MAG: ABC transporter permease subunit [Phycisphaerales bacterium]